MEELLLCVVLASLVALACESFLAARRLRFLEEQSARLTRRVWKLEGCPPCDCGAEDCQ